MNKKSIYFGWLFIIGALIGVLAGGLLGVAFGLLFTPKPGSEFRSDLIERFKEFSALFWDKIKSSGKTQPEE